jgi:hypothetical protein
LTKGDLPEDWQARDLKSYYRLIKNLDQNSRGFVDFKRLCTYICLLATPIPNELNISEYSEALIAKATQGWLDEQTFVSIPAFFDYYESSAHSEASKNFC